MKLNCQQFEDDSLENISTLILQHRCCRYLGNFLPSTLSIRLFHSGSIKVEERSMSWLTWLYDTVSSGGSEPVVSFKVSINWYIHTCILRINAVLVKNIAIRIKIIIIRIAAIWCDLLIWTNTLSYPVLLSYIKK